MIKKNKTPDHRHPTRRFIQGVSLVETALILPLMLLMGLGILQYAFVYKAKSTLNYAALMAARAGAVDHAKPSAIRTGFARGLAPMYSPGPTEADRLNAMGKVGKDIIDGYVYFAIINPTTEAFEDYSLKDQEAPAVGGRVIPSATRYLRNQPTRITPDDPNTAGGR